jgi:hypothetical protein
MLGSLVFQVGFLSARCQIDHFISFQSGIGKKDLYFHLAMICQSLLLLY